MTTDNDALEPDDPSQGTITPLPGEAGIPDVAKPARGPLPRKELLVIAVAALSLVVVSALWIHRIASRQTRPEAVGAHDADKPAAASTGPRRLELPPTPLAKAASQASSIVRVPAIVAAADDDPEPIGVHRIGAEGRAQTANPPGIAKKTPPEDAPVMLATSANLPATSRSAAGSQDEAQPPAQASLEQFRQGLAVYQRQLQTTLDHLGSSSAAPEVAAVGRSLPSQGSSAPSTPLLGILAKSQTPRVKASMLGDRSLTLPKGTAFTCALTTKVVSATAGLVGCLVQRNVYSDDGRVLLVERGSHMDGEYRVTSLKPGTVRIPILWTRLRTPEGVTADLDSPASGQLGESGIEGYVDNRWPERIGAAMLLSVIDDAVKIVVAHESDSSNGNGTVLLPSTTDNTSKLAEKVLDSTINIPPLIYRNQGGVVGVYVARDVDFSSVYALEPR